MKVKLLLISCIVFCFGCENYIHKLKNEAPAHGTVAYIFSFTSALNGEEESQFFSVEDDLPGSKVKVIITGEGSYSGYVVRIEKTILTKEVTTNSMHRAAVLLIKRRLGEDSFKRLKKLKTITSDNTSFTHAFN